MDPLAVLAPGLGIIALVGWAMVAGVRRDFRRRVATLQRMLDEGSAPSFPRPDLPPEILALAHRIGASADKRHRFVRLRQRGEMWLQPGATPLRFEAEQTSAVAEVGFLWRARAARRGGLALEVIDYLVAGSAGLEARLFGVLPVVRVATSDAMIRGEALRYLAELMWNPDAILGNRDLDWRVIDQRTVAVATGAGPRRCEVRLTLDAAGDVIGVTADNRPRLDGGRVVACPWFARGRGYRTIAGRRIPVEGEAGWRIDGTEFIYWRGRIEAWEAVP